jgi:hypothetical protein
MARAGPDRRVGLRQGLTPNGVWSGT